MRMNHKRILTQGSQGEMPIEVDILKVSVISDLHLNSVAVDDENFPNLSNPPIFYYTARKKLEQYVAFVNQQVPEVVIHLGDVIDGANYESSFALFNQYWSEINPNIKKSISAGNHDYPWLGSESLSHEYVANVLGYGSKPLVAGSKMNESFSVCKNGLCVKFINYESNIDINGVHNSVGGYITPDTINWISTEIDNSEENIIILYGHKARNYLEYSSRVALETMLANKLNSIPDLKLYWLYGHSHIWQTTKYATEIGSIPVYGISGIVDNISGEFYTFNITENGIESIDIHWASY